MTSGETYITAQKKLRNRRAIHSSGHTLNMQALRGTPHTEEYKSNRRGSAQDCTVCEVFKCYQRELGTVTKLLEQGSGVADTSTEKNGSKTDQFLQSHEQGHCIRISPSNTTQTADSKIVPCKESYSAKL